MATPRQKKAAKLVVENLTKEEPLTGGEIVENSRYSHSMAIKPGVILNSKGVQQELKEVYGFDPETAKNVVADILIGSEDDGHRLKAADMIFKVHGSYAAEKHANFNLNMQVNESNDALEEAAKAYGAAAIKRRIS